MVLTDEEKKAFVRRLLISRMRILCSNGFYGLLLMHVPFGLDATCPTAYTDGRRIMFHPDFLKSLSDEELDFVMMHEIMHIVLKHCTRTQKDDAERYNIACDIVVNSNILKSNDMKLKSISVGKTPSMHLTPSRQEGYLYTAEEVYEMLPPQKKKKKNSACNNCEDNEEDGGAGDDNGAGKNSGVNGAVKDGNGAGKHSGGAGKNSGGAGKNSGGAGKNDGGAGGGNGAGKNGGGAGKNASGAGKDDSGAGNKENSRDGKEVEAKTDGFSEEESFDDHTHWDMSEEEAELWTRWFEDAVETVLIHEANTGRGTLPEFARRILKDLRKAQTDWRTVLSEFVQEEVNDYSFSPPDRRYEGDFFLPDFSDKEAVPKDILFMVDTSGSMSDDMVTAAYSEVKGAIDQFNGKLKGWLGYFDAEIIEPVPFESVEELIPPVGGGGTDFSIIFKYVEKYMQTEPPACIIILTDGYAPFPEEKAARGIPVLWLLNNEKVTPPWGKIARIEVKEGNYE